MPKQQTYALIKFTVSSTRDRGIIAAIDFGNVIAFNARNLVHGQVSSQRHCQIVSQRQYFSALIFQVVNQFGVFAVFAGQHFLQFEYWRVDGLCTVLPEHVDDFVQNTLSQCHLLGTVVASALGCFEREFLWCGRWFILQLCFQRKQFCHFFFDLSKFQEKQNVYKTRS